MASHIALIMALLLGISNYTQLRSLPNARFEAATIAAQLSENDFDVETVPNNMLGRGEGSAREDCIAIVDALDRLAAKVREDPGCIVLIYYAGHGAMMSSRLSADQVLMGCDWPAGNDKCCKLSRKLSLNTPLALLHKLVCRSFAHQLQSSSAYCLFS
jgi:Caspase domain